ncbi:mannose-1-phosphate guanylyltransferase/mannose-6-phosphate isomerase [Psychrobacillus sp. FSL K6-4615]|uniref:mannose-1-phosphate guanylyltransferase/mannose-6-phosphate isomerase n=1 Tax=Psychrobacillus sp. FSL K6-4615 TaxID=2921551 RepID=UPI0030FB816A
MINLILCGGNGTRLWPISRTLHPKQFSKFDGKSLFQETVLRNSKYTSKQIIVTNTEQQFLAKDQLNEIGNFEPTFILEPVGRNTAAAIALACHSLEQDDIILVTPSDHLIKNKSEYEAIIAEGKKLAEEGSLVTFGITPVYPETGYGYIQAIGKEVISFKEKPSVEVAQEYIKSGTYYWNSGMFMFKSSTFLKELEKYAPEIFTLAKEAIVTSEKVNENISINLGKMSNIPDLSVDYAVMENSDSIKIIPSNISWSDMGSFESLYEGLELPIDEQGNMTSGKNVSLNSKNNLILSNKTVATINVEDLIIVDTPDALLVSSKGSSHEVKKVVEQLKVEQPNLVNEHITAHRPWGVYTILEDSPGFKIKKIVVKPGKKLSLQKHHHRNEHWVVVSGTATVTVGENEFFVRPNESTYIKMGEVHRLENSGKIDLVLIEVQVGEYLEEDDIIRIEDDFKRR